MPDLPLPETIRLTPENWSVALDLEKAFAKSEPFNFEVDLGCGKGRFLTAHAAANKEICFLGIDRRRARILKVERKVLRLGLENIRLLHAEALYSVENLMPEDSVSVYYLFFPDPWPKRRHHRRRLFDANFLSALHRTLRKGGRVHVATDHLDYFAAIQRIFSADSRFAEIEPFIPDENTRTDFELVFLSQNKPIGRCSFMKKAR